MNCPPDPRVLKSIETKYRNLDPRFIDFIATHQGATPAHAYFTDARGATHRIGRFLTLVDAYSTLPPPRSPSFENPERDRRIDLGITTLIQEESATARGLFGGHRLLPFAALFHGDNHPDEMSLPRGHVSLLCLFTGDKPHEQKVLVWFGAEALAEHTAWEQGLDDYDDEDEAMNAIRYDRFTVDAGSNIGEFVASLRRSP